MDNLFFNLNGLVLICGIYCLMGSTSYYFKKTKFIASLLLVIVGLILVIDKPIISDGYEILIVILTIVTVALSTFSRMVWKDQIQKAAKAWRLEQESKMTK